MAKDWLDEYLSDALEEGQRQEVEQLKAELAVQGSERLFRALATRVKSDIERYTAKNPPTALRYDFQPSRMFAVRRSTFPSVTLEVELKGAYVEYRASLRRDDTSETNAYQSALEIVSDLSGSVQFSQSGVLFQDESEVSAALLKPILDFLRTR